MIRIDHFVTSLNCTWVYSARKILYVRYAYMQYPYSSLSAWMALMFSIRPPPHPLSPFHARFALINTYFVRTIFDWWPAKSQQLEKLMTNTRTYRCSQTNSHTWLNIRTLGITRRHRRIYFFFMLTTIINEWIVNCDGDDVSLTLLFATFERTTYKQRENRPRHDWTPYIMKLECSVFRVTSFKRMDELS